MSRRQVAWGILGGVGFCLALLVSAVSGSAEGKRLSVYSEAANYTVTVVERGGVDYVDLQELLAPLGPTSARADGHQWKLRYKNLEAEFSDGRTLARAGGQTFDLPASFLLQGERGLAPLASLPLLVSRFLGTPVNLHENSRRLFIGNVAVHFTAQISRATPIALVMNFTSPVNPMIATEPGRLRMVFTHEPVVPPGSQTLTFDSTAIPSATFQENNGAAEITVSGPVPLFASFSNDGRTITITPAPQASNPAMQAQNQAPAAPAAPPVVAPPEASSAQPSPRASYFAVVDASHGGEERGAALSDQLAEKDVTLAFARRLGQEMQAHNLPALLLREGDVTLTLDQRATRTNAARPAVYVCLHASSQGSGVRLYTALLPAGGENRGLFLDWEMAQGGFRVASQAAESSLAVELATRQVAVRSLAAPLRPLNNVTAAAVAIEIAPPSANVADLNSPAYQQLVAEAVTAALEAVKEKLGALR